LEAERDAAETAHHDAFARVPNLPHPDAPDGDEGDGVVLRTVGTMPTLEGVDGVRDHVTLLEAADALDLARGAKVSGSRFAYLKGEGALLELALIRYAVDVAMAHGHVPVVPPVLVREPAMYGTGFLPTDEQQLFATRDDDLYLVGTSEVPLAGMHMDEVLDPAELPLRYAGISPCFRREAGAHGKDTKGIFRVHQFEKVELFSLVAPEDGDAEHQRILATQLAILEGLELHAQVVDIPVGDLGSSAARKFDVEAWIPSQGAYRELTSCSDTTDYQARRLRIRTRVDGGDNTLVHTLNGTALAVQRTIIALVEQHQRADGTVTVPAALVPYLGREVLFAG
jgi:seryl-tRNA synthetase